MWEIYLVFAKESNLSFPVKTQRKQFVYNWFSLKNLNFCLFTGLEDVHSRTENECKNDDGKGIKLISKLVSK